jgi:nitrite reductase (NADH) small subunit|tara:strand:- start:153 stop:479 length:327 start_codon:yes stop_codon:yes gene_type:complete
MSNWIEVGPVEEIPKLGARVVKTNFGDIAVFRTAEGKVFALRDECPHKKGALSQGIIHGERVTCPLHNWVIELQNGQAVAPDVGCTPKYETKVESGIIYLGSVVTEAA